jgi:hypothetical protein
VTRAIPVTDIAVALPVVVAGDDNGHLTVAA